jgi:ubiquitin carboxyl-terminal hydrolase 4/11/15
MYGQLKSTVQCAECGKISITYDPFLTLPLPISKPNFFQIAYVPYELYRKRTVVLDSGKADSSSEEDPDFKDDSKNTVQ